MIPHDQKITFESTQNPSRLPLDNLKQISNIEEQYFPHPWNLKLWQETTPFEFLTLSLNHGNITGLILLRYVEGDDFVHLLKILVLPHCRATGLSEKLFKQGVNKFHKLGVSQVLLEVSSLNLRAIAFYRRLGFEGERISKNFYQNGDDALCMVLNLRKVFESN